MDNLFEKRINNRKERVEYYEGLLSYLISKGYLVIEDQRVRNEEYEEYEEEPSSIKDAVYELKIEESFFAEACKNDYATKFLKSEIDKIYNDDTSYDDEDEEIEESVLNTLNYDHILMFTLAQDNLENIESCLKLLIHSEDNNGLDLLLRFSRKSFKEIFRLLDNHHKGNLYTTKESLYVTLFGMSLMNLDYTIIPEDDLDELAFKIKSYKSARNKTYLYNKNILNELSVKKITDRFNFNEDTTLQEIFIKLDKELYEECRMYYFKELDYEDERQARNSIIEKDDDYMTWFKRTNSITARMKDMLDYHLQAYLVLGDDIDRILNHKIYADVQISALTFLMNKRMKCILKDTPLEQKYILLLLQYVFSEVIEKKNEIVAESKVAEITSGVQSIESKKTMRNDIKRLTKELEDANVSLKSKDDENERLKRELEKERLKNRVKNKKSKVTDFEKEELYNLRETLFNLENNTKEIAISISNEINLNNYKLGFVGGSDTLRNKLKEKHPSMITVSPDDYNKNMNHLKGLDHIFIQTGISHSMYYKVIEIIKSSKIKYTILSESNLDIVYSKIINALES